MRRRFFVVLTALTASVALYMPSASAHSTRYIDDSCSVPGGGLFYADGPAQYWYVKFYGPSPGGCHLWTTTITNWQSPINTASWYLPISSGNNGNYITVAFVPCDEHSETTDARYRRYRNGTGGGVTSTHSINQAAACNVDPVVHQTLYYDGGQGGYLKMIDPSWNANVPVSADRLGYIATH